MGRDFIARFAEAFVKHSSSRSLYNAEAALCISRQFFRWVLDNQRALKHFVSTLRVDCRTSNPKDWEDVLALWRLDVISKPHLANVTKYNKIKCFNGIIRRLFIFGVIPKFYLVKPPTEFRATRPTKTLAEVSSFNSNRETLEILGTTLSGASENGIELQMKRDFLSTLINETGEIAGSPLEQAKLLMKINSDRLAAIRQCAERDFKRALNLIAAGQRALADSDMTFAEVAELVDRKVNKRFCFDLFPENDPYLSLCRLLTYVNGHPNIRGRVIEYPRYTLLRRVSDQMRILGGADLIQAHLLPSIDLTNAVIVMILCDTGANVSVARTLRTDCLQKSENRHFKIVIGNKLRSGGKLIVDELPIKDPQFGVSCVEAIQSYLEASGSLHLLASKRDSNFLFLRIGEKGVVKPVSVCKWAKWFRAFVKRHPEIAHLNLQAKMIRPSVLMQASSNKEVGIVAAAALGDHSMRTANHYIARHPTKVFWEHMIRTFQTLFQTVSIYSIRGAAQKLGLTRNQAKSLFGEACRTGLGVACLNPKSGIQPGTLKGKTCTEVQNCHSCSNRVVIATVENLRDLILWNRHIERCRSEWEVTRPERWEQCWLPWLVFTRVAIEESKRGRTAGLFHKANAIATAMIERNEVNLPLLW